SKSVNTGKTPLPFSSSNVTSCICALSGISTPPSSLTMGGSEKLTGAINTASINAWIKLCSVTSFCSSRKTAIASSNLSLRSSSSLSMRNHSPYNFSSLFNKYNGKAYVCQGLTLPQYKGQPSSQK